MTDTLCEDCKGGAERCAREGHLLVEMRTVHMFDYEKSATREYRCRRCGVTLAAPCCASCSVDIGPAKVVQPMASGQPMQAAREA